MSKRVYIPLFWWSETRLMKKERENYGDLLSPYLAEKISGQKVKWVQPAKKKLFQRTPRNYLSIGSILHHANKNSVVWGTGIIDQKLIIQPAEFKAVRGPETRLYLLSQNLNCPEIYGDPALLLPLYFKPRIEKKYQIGLIPHYVDLEVAKEKYQNSPGIKVIDLMTNNIEDTTREILECESVVSTSLHGGIVAHAYGIPAVFAKLGNRLYGSGIKFKDYLSSVGIEAYNLPELSDDLETIIKSYENSVDPDYLTFIQNRLLNNCPFKK